MDTSAFSVCGQAPVHRQPVVSALLSSLFGRSLANMVLTTGTKKSPITASIYKSNILPTNLSLPILLLEESPSEINTLVLYINVSLS